MFGMFDDFRGRRRIRELSEELERERRAGGVLAEAEGQARGLSEDLRGLLADGVFRFFEYNERHRGLPRFIRAHFEGRLDEVLEGWREEPPEERWPEPWI